MSSNLVLESRADAYDHSACYRSLTPAIVDFTDIPLCFAPPYTLPFYSKSADTLSCMDHPDLPAGLRLPRKTKSRRSSRSDRDVRLDSHCTPSITSAGSGEKRPRSSLSFDQRMSNTQNFAIHPAVAPLDPGLQHRQQAIDSYLPPQPQKDAVPRRRFTLLSRKSKLLSIKTSLDEAPARQQQAQRHPVTRMDSRLMHGKPDLPPSANTSIITPAVSVQDGASAKSLSPPSTPGFMRRLIERIETAPGPRTPSPMLSFQDSPKPVEANLAEPQDLALFAAATAGLSPEQPFGAAQMRQYVPLSQPRYRYTTSKSYTSSVPLALSPSRNQPPSSLSQGSGSLSIPASSFDYGSASSSGGSRSRPSVPRMSSDTGPRGTEVLSQSNPLPTLDTSSSRECNASRRRGPNGSASRSIGVPRPSEPVMQDVPPMPFGSRPVRLPSPTPLMQTSSHLQVQTQQQIKSSPANSLAARPVMSPISPPDTAIPWLDDNISTLTVDTLAYRHNPRISAISTLSSISALDGGVSPIDPEDDCELPDYRTSQEEMARMRQFENARRAQELQRRWIMSRGN